MTMLLEGDLQIKLVKGTTGRKFDDHSTHGLSHCMKAVDFVVEVADRCFFIECKDPDDPAADASRRAEFVNRLLSGRIDDDLKTKYRDSFLYEWASGRVDKPIYYLVLIALETLSEADLLTRTDALKRCLPLAGPGTTPWKRPFVSGCAVMNLASWNRQLPKFPITRKSA